MSGGSELISGLRGAADVDGDGRIEYSEIYAFLSSANRDLVDSRAHLSVVVKPPSFNSRAALIDLRGLDEVAHLTGAAAALGPFYIEDERGNRLLDFHAEQSFLVQLALPPNQRLFVHSAGGEAQLFFLAPGRSLALESIVLEPGRLRPRGAVETALRRGLFAAAFGPRYYAGFADRHDELMAVPLPSTPQLHEQRARQRRRRSRSRNERRALFELCE